MPASLYDVSIKTYLQILPALIGLIDKAQAHAAENGLDDSDMLSAKLAPDMWAFSKQVFQAVSHSLGTIKGLKAGEYSPNVAVTPSGYAGLRQHVKDAIDELRALDPAEVNALEHGEMTFVFGETRLPFTPMDYVLSFGLPNFYFHATTAYAILRNQGLPVGKMDFLGQLRLKA